MSKRAPSHHSVIAFALLPLAVTALSAASLAEARDAQPIDPSPCCQRAAIPGTLWQGRDPEMTIEELAAYSGPILWFSPDEPLLNDARGTDIMLPEPFPFEAGSGPVVYYRVRNILLRESAQRGAYRANPTDRGRSLLDLRQIKGIDLDFFFYYHAEEGFGGHPHDVESVEMKLAVIRAPEGPEGIEGCPACPFTITVQQVVAKAHGVPWYDNALDIDRWTRLPIHILVEEGKHASCTDKNGDGYYTPGYDVSRRINDAWGVRDVIRSGGLFTGGFQGWMAKVRNDDQRVFPPLPADSTVRRHHVKAGQYAPEYAQYELRPFPSAERAAPDLVPFIADKGDPRWPALTPDTDIEQLARWLEEEPYVKSLSISYRYDGQSGLSIIFPLFLVKHFEEPLAHGYIVNRIYLKDTKLRDLGLTWLYTLSASRWVDGYFAAGLERDVFDTATGTDSSVHFVSETGIKFRVNLYQTPLRFLTAVTDFWGIRFGIKSIGFPDFTVNTYVIEIGAGAF